jgi:hypothetical protein
MLPPCLLNLVAPLESFRVLLLLLRLVLPLLLHLVFPLLALLFLRVHILRLLGLNPKP